MPRGIDITGWRFKGIRFFGIALGSARSVTKMEDDLRRHYEKHLYCQGATSLVPGVSSYHLFSPNGGNDWYAIGKNDCIIGTAEEIYPGLLAHLDGWEALADHVHKSGPVDPTSPGCSNLLERAGFTVVTDSPD